MGRAALWFAKWGLAVFPVHEPLFDHPLGYTCTCEEWRHSDWAKKNAPHRYLEPAQHCDGPGKCPRGKWRDESTTDPETIRRWWRRLPTANIGIDCGKNGLLVLDADTYKDRYSGDGLLTRADEETVTVLTGGGGTHLWYKRPDGKDWGNAKKGLPDGIDNGLISVTRRLTIFSFPPFVGGMVNLRATYSARKADDVFLTGLSRTKRDEAEKRKKSGR